MGRRLSALIAAGLATGLALLHATRVTAAGAAPTGGAAPVATIPLGGDVEVLGKRLRIATELYDEPFQAVLERERRRWAEAPVDLAELPLEGGVALAILDVPNEVHRVIALRRQGERTEVVRGWSSLRGGEVEPPPPLPLPSGWLLLGRVDDRVGGERLITATALVRSGQPEARTALTAHLVAAGWRERDGAGDLASRFVRPGAELRIEWHGQEAATEAVLVLREGVQP